ncbi:MAG: acetyl-CoA carboxylase carboxyl transferase subunit beta [Firmicutes bacterium HGW-Firmicutes-1]|jgi:acetyl-CoA carboxylase carboxyl transferase subunit beta|nr:MAG: acetyl-CoA carboxylase carboxyl transferase subunit beta [Firmicutes bacterium HGW-Firmicutes-1]
MVNLFIKTKYINNTPKYSSVPKVPKDMWVKCEFCGEIIYKDDFHSNNRICIKCEQHFRLDAWSRINLVIDEGTFGEAYTEVVTKNVLNFPSYETKISALQEKTGLIEGVVTGFGKIKGIQAAIGVMDSGFLMGSMGAAVGEKITLLVEEATRSNLPLIIFCASGGARMQEGIISLMQMAKTAAAVGRFSDQGGLYITVLTDPTTGGVTASFAMLGDIILAEPGSLIGFAGPRVIKQTIKQDLPEGFQRAEFLLEHGFIDKIVNRNEMKETLYHIIKLHK